MCWHHLWRGWKRYAANLLKKFFKSTIFPSNIKKHRNIKGWEVDVLYISFRIGLKSKIGNFYFNRPAEAESHLVKRFTFQHFKTEYDVFVGSDRCWCLHPDLRSSCLPLWVGHHEASSLGWGEFAGEARPQWPLASHSFPSFSFGKNLFSVPHFLFIAPFSSSSPPLHAPSWGS